MRAHAQEKSQQWLPKDLMLLFMSSKKDAARLSPTEHCLVIPVLSDVWASSTEVFAVHWRTGESP